MGDQVHIRCSKCGVFNVNNEYCENCGNLLSIVKQREIKRKISNEKTKLKQESTPPSKIEKFINKLRGSKFWIVRVISEMIYIGWIVVMAIGTFLAWLVATIVA